VLPIAEHPDELVFEAPKAFASGPSWEPIAPSTLEAAEEAGITEDAVDADSEVDESADVEAPASLPALHVWDRTAPAPATVPPDAYSLRLVAARTLYDAGRTAASSPSIAPLAPGASLTVHPNDLARIGVQSEGDDVRVTSSRGTVTLPVRADAATAPGTAFIAFAQGGTVGAADVIDIESVVTELRVETVR
jgi:anaerobic selenocysteine-containing dehydrogenase